MFSRKSVFSIVFVLLTALMTSSFASARPLTISFTPQSQLISGGVQAGFANDVDNSPVYQTGYQNVKVVAKSGGDFTTITDALNSIMDASDTNRYLVSVAPGVYEEQVTMKEYVDIEGAGELATTVIFGASDHTLTGANFAELRFLTVKNTNEATSAIAIYNSNTSPRLTHITAHAAKTSSSGNSYGVFNESASPIMTNVTATGWGGAKSHGVYNSSSSSPTMTNVATSAAGGGVENYSVYNSSSAPIMINVVADSLGGMYNYGVMNYNSSPIMTNVTASAWNGMSYNYGIYNRSSSPTMMNVDVRAWGGMANYGVTNSFSSSPRMTDVTVYVWGGTENCGVQNSSSSPMMTNVIITASGETKSTNSGVMNNSSSPRMTNLTVTVWDGGVNYGIRNYDASSPIINNSFIVAGGGTIGNYGISNSAFSGSYIVQINNSQITGDTNTIRNDAHFSIGIGASQLTGGPVTGGGTIICAGVYDENYTFFASTCP